MRGFNLLPACCFKERRYLEIVITSGLIQLDGELKGTYFPLNGSDSTFEMIDDGKRFPNMSHDERESLRKNGALFQEPDSTVLLSSGYGRDWPDARGIFRNEVLLISTLLDDI